MMSRTDQITPFDQGKRAFMMGSGVFEGHILPAVNPFTDENAKRSWEMGHTAAEIKWFAAAANRPRQGRAR